MSRVGLKSIQFLYDFALELFTCRDVSNSLHDTELCIICQHLIVCFPSHIAGKFLSMKDEDVEPVELADRFFLWLDHVGSAGGAP